MTKLIDSSFTGDHIKSPAYLPDGRIVFATAPCRPCATDIFRMNGDGSGIANLTNTRGIEEFGPTPTPDGSLIAYSGVHRIGGDPTGTLTMKLDGTERKRLDIDIGHPAYYLTLSPDGLKVAFVERDALGNGISSMNLGGSAVRPLTTEPLQISGLDWGPRPVPLP